MPAVEARPLGTALLTATCREHRQLALRSYDRLFPNQDTLPTGGFGGLIALPFQHEPRSHGCPVFVDDAWQPFEDQWEALVTCPALSPLELRDRLLALRAAGPEIDATLPVDEEDETPWRRPVARPRVSRSAPAVLRLALARLAHFQNPEFYRAHAVRRSVWNVPRLIGCARKLPAHVALPRGACDAVLALARERGTPLTTKFTAELTADQQSAVQALAWAPTGFGKTVVAAALIARRAVSTLVLVHRAELLKQWRARRASFLDVPLDDFGALGDGRTALDGRLDVALLQSVSRRQPSLDLTQYGHVVVDECHHAPAVSFEEALGEVPATYVTGLTAAPIRRDGQHPIMQLQLGRSAGTRAASRPASNLRSFASRASTSSRRAIRQRRSRPFWRGSRARERNDAITCAIKKLIAERRRVLVLTECPEHLQALADALGDPGCPVILLHGRLCKRARGQAFDVLAAVSATSALVVLATGRLIGEGFDDARLDALVVALPFSWKGTVQQYVGRLMRPAPGQP